MYSNPLKVRAEDEEETMREKREVKEEVSQSEILHRMIVEAAHDIIWVLDIQGNFTFLNRCCEEACGYDHSEWLGKSISLLVHPDDQIRVREGLSSLSRGNRFWTDELRAFSKGGIFTLSVNAVPLNENGKVTGTVLFGRNVTEERRIKEALRQERDKLKGILDAMKDGIYIVNGRNEIQYINPVIESEFGPVYGRKCYEYFHDLSEVCSWCKNQEVIAGQTVEREWYSARTDKTYDVLDTPIFNEDGTISKLTIFHDITDRKRAEKALRESEKQLRHLSSELLSAQEMERRRISRELHDELGQALAGLKLQVGYLRRPSGQNAELQEEFEETMCSIDRTIESLRRISRDLSPYVIEYFGLSDALQRLFSDFTKIHDIPVRFAPIDINHFSSKETQIILYRIFQEILNNIRKHANAKSVTVVIGEKVDHFSFSVKDDGKGFYVDEILSKDPTQKGLGLTIIQERVRMLGGTFSLSSQEGKGTQIFFTAMKGGQY